jgi:hypothetical protein
MDDADSERTLVAHSWFDVEKGEKLQWFTVPILSLPAMFPKAQDLIESARRGAERMNPNQERRGRDRRKSR